ncbi:MAG: DNA double-strand break repair nuclease NurA [Rhodothermales bacterium]
MLDLHAVQQQLREFYRYQSEAERERAGKLDRALAALRACEPVWDRLADAVDGRPTSRLHARPLESPGTPHDPKPRPAEVTVVATDGSQIFPDRHVEPTCFLLNIGRIAFQYGTLEPPLMDASPHVKYRARDIETIAGDGYDTATEAVVSALRDELELTDLLATATASRVDGRPIVALSDGTLIRWMLRSLRDRALEDRLLRAYTDTLEGFRAAGIPVCSYISLPGNAELINTLGVYLHLFEQEPDALGLDGLVDHWLLSRHLRPGQRSALFATQSHIQKDYPKAEQIVFFYFRTDAPAGASEIARVELPHWVSEQPGALDLIHSVVLDECRKGRGYPMILSEAHEQAVVRGADRVLFFEMLETLMVREGHPAMGSMKRASKQRPLI